MSKVELESYKDKAGQDVRVGDFIVYGSLLGRSAALKFGKVTKICHDESKMYAYSKYSISVIGCSSWSTGKGTLQFPDRTLKINGLLPEDVIEKIEKEEDRR